MKTIQVKHDGYSVTVSEATVQNGIMRTVLAQRVADEERNKTYNSSEESMLAAVKVAVWPSLVACVVEQNVSEEWPIPFEKFIALPDEFVGKWLEAVRSLNPHWFPESTGNRAEEVKKKR